MMRSGSESPDQARGSMRQQSASMNGDEPPAKRARVATRAPIVGGGVCDVVVGHGADIKFLHIHQSVLSEIPYFRDYFGISAERHIDRKLPLPQDDPTVVEVYFSWLYSHIVASEEPWTCASLAKLHVFRQRMAHKGFQNDVIDLFCKHLLKLTRFPLCSFVKIIYEGTSEGMLGRRLLADFYCYHLKVELVDSLMSATPDEFVRDCMKAMVAKRPVHRRSRPWKNSEQYHVKA